MLHYQNAIPVVPKRNPMNEGARILSSSTSELRERFLVNYVLKKGEMSK